MAVQAGLLGASPAHLVRLSGPAARLSILPVWRACVPMRAASVVRTGCVGAMVAGAAASTAACCRDRTRCGKICGCVIKGVAAVCLGRRRRAPACCRLYRSGAVSSHAQGYARPSCQYPCLRAPSARRSGGRPVCAGSSWAAGFLGVSVLYCCTSRALTNLPLDLGRLRWLH